MVLIPVPFAIYVSERTAGQRRKFTQLYFWQCTRYLFKEHIYIYIYIYIYAYVVGFLGTAVSIKN